MDTSRVSRLPWSAAAIFFVAAVVATRDGFAEDAPARPWSANAQATYVATRGNTNTSTEGAAAEYKHDWTHAGLELKAAALGTSSAKRTTGEQYSASEKALWKLPGRDYVYEKVGWNRDRFAGVADRVDASLGLGRELIKRTHHDLICELGAGYVDEQRIRNPRVGFVAGRAYAKYTWTITPSSAFTQDGEYLHDFKNAKGYRVNTETALVSAISTHFSTKLALKYRHANQPAPRFVKDDTEISASLIFSY